MDKVIIFDTTLRDGEQAPGASLDLRQKIQVAHQLERLNVDVIEAGFPISSDLDFKAVKTIASEIKKPVICALARAKKEDIDAAYKSIGPANRKRIHVFLATSKIHMQYKLKKAQSEILKQAIEAVKYAKGKVEDVEFSPEDASRTDLVFLAQIVEAVIAAGATTVNIPDTVGYATPEDFGKVIKYLKGTVTNINKAVISTHCHDDLGMATANSLSAVVNGARQIECTINGIGERAGSAPLEEVVMAIKTRADFYKVKTSIKTKELYKSSRLISHLMGIRMQPNKAIIGDNAFSHESGIHQDGVIKERSTYEIMKPEDVGFKESKLVLGRHSGRHAFKVRLQQLGFNLDKTELQDAFEKFMQLANKKKEIYDEDLQTIVEGQIAQTPQIWELLSVKVVSETDKAPVANVEIKSKGKTYQIEATGDGPVDACYKAIDKIVKLKGRLIDYSLQSVTRGKDALGEVVIKVRFKNQEIVAKSSSTDIFEASAKAYINAINKVLFSGKIKP
jgi:2-isopropylmalate synthase